MSIELQLLRLTWSALQAARLRRIAHYEDLERNYKLAEEWVLW